MVNWEPLEPGDSNFSFAPPDLKLFLLFVSFTSCKFQAQFFLAFIVSGQQEVHTVVTLLSGMRVNPTINYICSI